MITLSKTRIAKRSLIFVTFFVAAMVGVFAAAKNIKLSQVDAAGTSTGNTVNVQWDTGEGTAYPIPPVPGPGDEDSNKFIYWKPGSSFGTPILVPIAGIKAYCIDPGIAAPLGEYRKVSVDDSQDDKYKYIKMAVYIASGIDSDAEAVRENWFYNNGVARYNKAYWDQNPETRFPGYTEEFYNKHYFVQTSYEEGVNRFEYLFMHIVVSALNHPNDTDLSNKIDTYVGSGTDVDRKMLDDVIADIKSHVDNNDSLWKKAKNYTLFNIGLNSDANVQLGENLQNIVWIEKDEFDVSTTATDRADGDKSIVASANVTIRDAVQYKVKENTDYQLKGVLKTASGADLLINGQKVVRTQTINSSTGTGTAYMDFTIDASGLSGQKIVVYEYLYDSDGKILLASHEDPNDSNQTVYVFSLGTTATDTDVNGDHYVEAKSGAKVYDEIEYCLKPGTQYSIEGTLHDKTTNSNIVTKTINYLVGDYACGTVNMIFNFDASGLAGHELVVYETVKQNNQTIITHQDDSDANQTVNIVSIDTSATDAEDGDQFIEAGSDVTITDHVEYYLKSGTNFQITGVLMDKTTKQPLLIDGDEVRKTVNVQPSANHGFVDITFDIDASELAGKEVVVFETASYGNTVVTSHQDIDDENQTVTIISISTTATDKSDDDKLLAVDKDVEIKDTVEYCLKAGEEFTIKGILMDKEAKQPVKIDGKTVEQTITFTPEEACGTTEMIYSLNTSGLGGADLVIFEDLYYDGEVILSHSNYEDKNQTVSVAPVPPDTGKFSSNSNGDLGGWLGGNTPFIAGLFVIIPGVYVGIRIKSRKKFFK